MASPVFSMGEIRKRIKELRIAVSGPNSNPESPEYKAGVLIIVSQVSILVLFYFLAC
jgi:hypothetical protein